MDASEIFTAVINVAALLFVGAQVQLARRALKDSAEGEEKERLRLRKQATIEISARTEHYREAVKAQLPWNDRDPNEVAAFLEAAQNDRAKLAPVRAYLNHLEDLAVGVRAEVYDLETVNLLWGGRILGVAASYAGYIDRIRLELNSPGVYEYFDELVEALRALRARRG